MDTTTAHSFGVFKPVGHVVISLPGAEQADAAAQALAQTGHDRSGVHRYTDQEMLAQIEQDLQHASPLAAVGQELNLIKAHRDLAERGYHWLVVKAASDDAARAIAQTARAHGAERAQYYGRFLIEELIERPDDLTQVAESPARELDAQTPSGEEAERVQRHGGEQRTG
ncbi:hypothetical protein [Ideonella sp.]|uniref:hypothetical protein n=1 Tax=Ideonella sp. TaxID=1929293 RepID=UPI0035B1C7FB